MEAPRADRLSNGEGSCRASSLLHIKISQVIFFLSFLFPSSQFLCTNMVYGLDTQALNNTWPSFTRFCIGRSSGFVSKLKLAVRHFFIRRRSRLCTVRFNLEPKACRCVETHVFKTHLQSHRIVHLKCFFLYIFFRGRLLISFTVSSRRFFNKKPTKYRVRRLGDLLHCRKRTAPSSLSVMIHLHCSQNAVYREPIGTSYHAFDPLRRYPSRVHQRTRYTQTKSGPNARMRSFSRFSLVLSGSRITGSRGSPYCQGLTRGLPP